VPSPAAPSWFTQVRSRAGQLVRYGAVSLIATTVSLTMLGVLVATDTLPAGWANVVATAVGTVPSFELNRRWVWGKRGRRSVLAEIGPFCVLSFAGLALSTLTVSVTAAWVAGLGLDAAGRTLVAEVANLAAFGSLWVLQFVVLDRFLFGPGARSRTTRTDVAGIAATRATGAIAAVPTGALEVEAA
jgi:putative flippase GtrA